MFKWVQKTKRCGKQIQVPFICDLTVTTVNKYVTEYKVRSLSTQEGSNRPMSGAGNVCHLDCHVNQTSERVDEIDGHECILKHEHTVITRRHSDYTLPYTYTTSHLALFNVCNV